MVFEGQLKSTIRIWCLSSLRIQRFRRGYDNAKRDIRPSDRVSGHQRSYSRRDVRPPREIYARAAEATRSLNRWRSGGYDWCNGTALPVTSTQLQAARS